MTVVKGLFGFSWRRFVSRCAFCASSCSACVLPFPLRWRCSTLKHVRRAMQPCETEEGCDGERKRGDVWGSGVKCKSMYVSGKREKWKRWGETETWAVSTTALEFKTVLVLYLGISILCYSTHFRCRTCVFLLLWKYYIWILLPSTALPIYLNIARPFLTGTKHLLDGFAPRSLLLI